MVVVKNAANGSVLGSNQTVVSQAATLRFVRLPLKVQIGDPGGADVFGHGRKRLRGVTQPWIFSVRS